MARNNNMKIKGFVGQEPKLIKKGEKSWAKFTVAVSIAKDKTMWMDVMATFNAENLARDLAKGSFVYAEGALMPNDFKKKDGTMEKSFTLWADDVEIVQRSASGKVNPTVSTETPVTTDPSADTVGPDDMPY